jgi:dTDP-4-amino-4,6-dideoxygalactose transaminase
MSELQTAMGLAVLPYVTKLLEARKERVEAYDQVLNFSKLRRITFRQDTVPNYSYYPVIFENEEILLEVKHALNKQKVFPRRYFHPSLNTLNYVKSSYCEASEKISKTILCLPLGGDLQDGQLQNIAECINFILSN